MFINNKYDEELKEVENKLLKMCYQAELAIEKSIDSLKNRNKELAKHVIEDDKIIDSYDREIEQDCFRILLMERPFASDFREISSALKMITDLERIGDYAVDIAEIVLTFDDKEYIKKIEHIPLMGVYVISMVKDSVQAYINKDVETARGLDKRDDKVDRLFDDIKTELIKLIKENDDNAEQAINFMMIAKYLERVGDHAVNIGEWVDFAITGTHSQS